MFLVGASTSEPPGNFLRLPSLPTSKVSSRALAHPTGNAMIADVGEKSNCTDASSMLFMLSVSCPSMINIQGRVERKIFVAAMGDFCLVVYIVYSNLFVGMNEDVDAVLFHLNVDKVVKLGLDLNVSRC